MLRAVNSDPPAMGTVFGFVTSGFNFGGAIAPLAFGALLDPCGAEPGVLGGVAALMLIYDRHHRHGTEPSGTGAGLGLSLTSR